MIARVAPPEHYQWIAERASLVIGPAFHAIEAIDGDRIAGMVGFDGWTESAVAMHVALDHPVAFRRLLRPAFGIAFQDPSRRVAICTVLSNNARSLRLVQHVGFREVFRGRSWWSSDVDVVFFEMKRAACRWIRPATQKERRWAA